MSSLHVVIRPAPSPASWEGTPATGVSARRRASRAALAEAAQHARVPIRRPFNAAAPPRDSHGAPLPLDGHIWTVSHTRHWVAAALWTGPVGLDLEGRRPLSPAVVGASSSPQERALMEEHWDGEEAFLRLWSAKESVLKRTGLGLAGLSGTTLTALRWTRSLTRLTLVREGRSFTVFQGTVFQNSQPEAVAAPEHWWSVSAQGDPLPSLHLNPLAASA